MELPIKLWFGAGQQRIMLALLGSAAKMGLIGHLLKIFRGNLHTHISQGPFRAAASGEQSDFAIPLGGFIELPVCI